MRRKPLTLSIVSIMLPIMVMTLSLNGYTQSLATPQNEELTLDVPPLDLDIPKPLKITHNGETIYGWNAKGYATILKVWTGYTLWAENYSKQVELDETTAERLELCRARLILKDDIITILTEDREHAYDLFNEERDSAKKIERSNTIKTVLIAGGTGIVAIAVGILIGWLARR